MQTLPLVILLAISLTACGGAIEPEPPEPDPIAHTTTAALYCVWYDAPEEQRCENHCDKGVCRDEGAIVCCRPVAE